jgi:hypothetical protein
VSAHFSSGLRQSTLDRPPGIKSSEKGVAANSDNSRPLGYGHSFVLERQQAIRSLVITLLNLRCPSHISRFVGLVIVDSIKAVFRTWTRLDILYEVLNRFPPPFTDGNTPPAIKGIDGPLGVIAAVHHALVGLVQRVIGEAVCGVAFASFLVWRGIMGLHREPPLFSVTRPGALERCRDNLLHISIIQQNAAAYKEVCY